MEKLPSQPVKGLIDGLAVLQELATSDRPQSSSELSKKLDLEVTRVNRILKTLAWLGITYRTNDRKYAPGAGIHVLAAQIIHASRFIQISLPYLEQLHQYQHIVALGVLWRENVSYLYHWEPGISSFEALGRLALYPVQYSSIGHILLASKPADSINEYFKNQLKNGEIEQFKREVTESAKLGYSKVHKYSDPSEISIAVRVGQPAFAGLALSGKMKEEEVSEYVRILQETSLKIQKEIQLG
jgi:DNA-binding IclR family transcriptional regulator